MVIRAAVILVLSTLSVPTWADEPVIDHQPVLCSLRGKNPRVCAAVADDGEVKHARVYFRAEGQEAFYWSEMAFDGVQYCATLPVAKKSRRSIEYYLWAVDDEFESQRTRTYRISLVPTAPCDYPVFDEEPDRISNLVVHATSPKQGKSIDEFEDTGIREFVPVIRRKK